MGACCLEDENIQYSKACQKRHQSVHNHTSTMAIPSKESRSQCKLYNTNATRLAADQSGILKMLFSPKNM